MKPLSAVLILSGVLAGAQALAEEHKHEQQKKESKAPAGKETDAAKADHMKCCEGMEKMGGMKEGMPMKGDMKAKMEKMKGMKEKMAEKMKMKAAKGGKPDKDDHSPGAKDVEKDPHQH